MEIVPFSKKHDEKWDKFCLKNDNAWLWHTTLLMELSLYRLLDGQSVNCSFFVENNDEILAAVPLTIDGLKRNTEMSERAIEMNYGGLMVPAPIVSEELKRERKDKVLKMVFNTIDKLAKSYNVQKLIMSIPLTMKYRSEHTCYNFLVKFGFHDVSLNTQIIDLTKDDDIRWKDLTTNHKRAITKGAKYLKFRLLGKSDINEKSIQQFKCFYFEAAGKVTHSDELFKKLYLCLSHNMGILAKALYKGKIVGYAIVLYYKDSACYLMGANESGFTLCPIAHFLHWETMKYLRNIGLSSYELGIQQFACSVFDQSSRKEVSISRFKRGFGGLTVPLFIGEKYYSKGYFRKVWQKRIDKYIEQYGN